MLATPLVASAALPHVVAGTKGMACSSRWYADITEVTYSAAIFGRDVDEGVEKRKTSRHNTGCTAHMN